MASYNDYLFNKNITDQELENEVQRNQHNIEDFETKINSNSRFLTLLLSIIISAALLVSAIHILNLAGLILLATLTIIVYIIINNMNGKGYENSLPFATYPLPPSLGHDGVSMSIFGFEQRI